MMSWGDEQGLAPEVAAVPVVGVLKAQQQKLRSKLSDLNELALELQGAEAKQRAEAFKWKRVAEEANAKAYKLMKENEALRETLAVRGARLPIPKPPTVARP